MPQISYHTTRNSENKLFWQTSNLFKKRPKHHYVTLVLIFHHQAMLFLMYWKGASVCTEVTLKLVLTKPQRVVLRYLKIIHDKLYYSKLKLTDDTERRNFSCARGNCEIFNIVNSGKEYESTATREIYEMDFHFDCNSLSVVYLIACKMCKKKYTSSTAKIFRVWFNQCKPNLKLYGEFRWGFAFRKILIEILFNHNHNGSYKDMMMQITDLCNSKD